MGREFHHNTIGTSHGVHSLQLSPSPYGGIGIIVATCRRLRHDVPRRPDLNSLLSGSTLSCGWQRCGSRARTRGNHLVPIVVQIEAT